MHHARPGVRVRAIEYTLPGHDEVYRLITTILDPDLAPATDLAAPYAQRWEFESTLDEIKTHLGGQRLGLRSQHPNGAEQELYGFLLVHHAIRHLMHQAAVGAGEDPDRVSFTRSLRVVRRQVTNQAAFSPPADSPAPYDARSQNWLNDFSRYGDADPTRASSNAKSPAGPSNGLSIDNAGPPEPTITIVAATKTERQKRPKPT